MPHSWAVKEEVYSIHRCCCTKFSNYGFGRMGKKERRNAAAEQLLQLMPRMGMQFSRLYPGLRYDK
jgi:hypothetical protein